MVAKPPLARLVFIAPDGSRAVVILAGSRDPDLAVVDTLSRLRLAACRCGRWMHVENAAGPLTELLELAGLLGEMCGKPEDGKDPVCIQEGMDLRDQIA